MPCREGEKQEYKLLTFGNMDIPLKDEVFMNETVKIIIHHTTSP